jgi:hypothetical protein
MERQGGLFGQLVQAPYEAGMDENEVTGELPNSPGWQYRGAFEGFG